MKKKILISLFTLILSSFFIVSLASKNNEQGTNDVAPQNNDIMINSPLFTSKETEKKYEYTEPSWTTEKFTFEKVLDNGLFELYIDPREGMTGSGAIRIKNKANGYVWCSDIHDIQTNPVYGKVLPPTVNQSQSSFNMYYIDSTDASAFQNPKTNITLDASVELDIAVDTKNYTVTYKVDNTRANIKFEYIVSLTSSGIEVELPVTSIKENGDNYLTQIQLFPYLGATYRNAPGYLMLPSGNGALIRFDKESSIASEYKVKYYGSDENVSSNNEADILSLPVYGITQGVNQNAMFARIKKGSAMATLSYVPVNVGGNVVNRAYNTLVYRETASISIPGGGSVDIIDQKFCNSDYAVSYSFLEGQKANYVGMALKYQDLLVNENVLSKNEQSGSTNVHVDVFGGETESGILFDKFVKMTTTDQLLSINHQLKDKVDNHIKYTLRGYYNKGYSYQSATNIKFNNKLGNLSDLEGLDYLMYYNPVESYSSKLSYPGDVLVNKSSNKHYVVMEKDAKYKFYHKVDSVISGVENTLEKYDSNVAFDALGYRLYGDTNAEYRRTDTANMYSELLGNEKYALYKPNEYLLSNTSEYLNASLYHGRLRFITDSVPFLQIVLRGYVDYYSSYLNFSTNQDIDLLKCIEYGSNPAYLITYGESHLLSNTLSNHLYATHFASNKDKMIHQIRTISDALNSVVGSSIVNREVIESGVVKVTYSNGNMIYVNYTNSEYVDPQTSVAVGSMNYKVVE